MSPQRWRRGLDARRVRPDEERQRIEDRIAEARREDEARARAVRARDEAGAGPHVEVVEDRRG